MEGASKGAGCWVGTSIEHWMLLLHAAVPCVIAETTPHQHQGNGKRNTTDSTSTLAERKTRIWYMGQRKGCSLHRQAKLACMTMESCCCCRLLPNAEEHPHRAGQRISRNNASGLVRPQAGGGASQLLHTGRQCDGPTPQCHILDVDVGRIVHVIVLGHEVLLERGCEWMTDS